MPGAGHQKRAAFEFNQAPLIDPEFPEGCAFRTSGEANSYFKSSSIPMVFQEPQRR